MLEVEWWERGQADFGVEICDILREVPLYGLEQEVVGLWSALFGFVGSGVAAILSVVLMKGTRRWTYAISSLLSIACTYYQSQKPEDSKVTGNSRLVYLYTSSSPEYHQSQFVQQN